MGGRPLTALAIAALSERGARYRNHPRDLPRRLRQAARSGRCAARRPHRAGSRDQVRLRGHRRDRPGAHAGQTRARVRATCCSSPSRSAPAIIGTAIKFERASAAMAEQAIASMRTLNRAAAEALQAPARGRRPRVHGHHRVRSGRPRDPRWRTPAASRSPSTPAASRCSTASWRSRRITGRAAWARIARTSDHSSGRQTTSTESSRPPLRSADVGWPLDRVECRRRRRRRRSVARGGRERGENRPRRTAAVRCSAARSRVRPLRGRPIAAAPRMALTRRGTPRALRGGKPPNVARGGSPVPCRHGEPAGPRLLSRLVTEWYKLLLVQR